MRYFTVQEMAERLKVSRWSVQKQIRSGHMRSQRFGKLWVVPEKEAKLWKAVQHGKIPRLERRGDKARAKKDAA